MLKPKLIKTLLFAVLPTVVWLAGNFQTGFCQTVQPVLFAPGVVSTEFNETSATFTPDRKTVYFTRSDVLFTDNTILESHFKNGKWSEPQVASFSGVWRDSEPHVSPDGSKLFFVSNRPASGDKPLVMSFDGQTHDGANIWYVEKKSNGWGEPIHIAGAINEFPSVYNPSIARSGTLYFSGVLPDEPTKNQIYRSVPVGEVYGKPERVSFSDTKWHHIDPTIDPDEQFMIFGSNRPGTMGNSFDLFICFQKNGKWDEPVNLGETVNSAALENAPVLAPDGKTLYFTSARPRTGKFPKQKRESYAEVTKRLRQPDNGSRNIWQVDITFWLEKGLK